MRRLTATEAARRFSDVLDAVETGRESFVVERRGRAVATIAPATVAGGRRLKALLAEQPVDDEWPRELDELRRSLVDDAPEWNG